VYFLDVGEGDSILIQMPDNNNILIDTGSLSAGYVVKKYLETKNIFHLEYIIITHMHPDHVGGIFNILPQIKTNFIYYNGYRPNNNHFYFELLNLAKKLNIPLKILKAGNQLFFGKVRLDALSPKQLLTENLNGDSIVLKISFGQVSFLLAGDLNINGEKRLMKMKHNLRSDVLKVSHHGAEDSNSEEFIDEVMPKIAVLSVGENNRYGHPSKEIIERFKIKEVSLYRTDFDGTVIIQTNGNTLSISLEKEKD